ncbi:hypothetical protein ABK040_016105 [Willaertia magna]
MFDQLLMNNSFDILSTVFSFLPYKQLLTSHSLTCKQWNEWINNSSYLWHSICVNELKWPSSPLTAEAISFFENKSISWKEFCKMLLLPCTMQYCVDPYSVFFFDSEEKYIKGAIKVVEEYIPIFNENYVRITIEQQKLIECLHLEKIIYEKGKLIPQVYCKSIEELTMENIALQRDYRNHVVITIKDREEETFALDGNIEENYDFILGLNNRDLNEEQLIRQIKLLFNGDIHHQLLEQFFLQLRLQGQLSLLASMKLENYQKIIQAVKTSNIFSGVLLHSEYNILSKLRKAFALNLNISNLYYEFNPNCLSSFEGYKIPHHQYYGVQLSRFGVIPIHRQEFLTCLYRHTSPFLTIEECNKMYDELSNDPFVVSEWSFEECKELALKLQKTLLLKISVSFVNPTKVLMEAVEMLRNSPRLDDELLDLIPDFE